MRKLLTYAIILCIFALSACSHNASPIPDATSTQKPIATPSPTARTTPTLASIPTPSPKPTPAPTTGIDFITDIPKDLVIIVQPWGNVIGGYANGQWLTHSDALRYCGREKTLYYCDIQGKFGKSHSSDVIESDWYDGYSYTHDMTEEEYDNGVSQYAMEMQLSNTIQDREPITDTNLLYIPEDQLPTMRIVDDTSDIEKRVQKIVDEQFGKNAVEAKITAAVSVDIDGDGKAETIFNATNINVRALHVVEDLTEEEILLSSKKLKWYSLTAVVNSDGQIHTLSSGYYTCYLEDSYLAQTTALADIDNDGQCEIIMDWEGYECCGTVVYDYDDKEFKPVLFYEYYA